ncbi:hypothetical protein CRUP_038598 [Coryphaenoides rupestris]|nr:hypothetical protein CRUP_038598 [Coryphaenoides rupestris]
MRRNMNTAAVRRRTRRRKQESPAPSSTCPASPP